jgi:hypothetical protein
MAGGMAGGNMLLSTLLGILAAAVAEVYSWTRMLRCRTRVCQETQRVL